MLSKRFFKNSNMGDLRRACRKLSLAIADATNRVRSNPTDEEYVAKQTKRRIEWFEEMTHVQNELWKREAEKIARDRAKAQKERNK